MPHTIQHPAHTRVPRRPYDSDMNDEEWEQYKLFFPELVGIPGVSLPKTTTREVLNAIRYLERTGVPFRLLPHDFPPWSTVMKHFYRWRDEGRFQEFREHMAARNREKAGRSAAPTVGAMDSQSKKTVALTPSKEVGTDGGKKIKGRKRHIFVDILGIVLAVTVTPASVQDRVGGAALMATVASLIPTMQLVLVDSAYNGDVMAKASQETGIKVEMVNKLEGQHGFVPIPKRWPVERAFGWMDWSRRLSKDYEKTAVSSQAWFEVAMGRLLSKRLVGCAPRIRQTMAEKMSSETEVMCV